MKFFMMFASLLVILVIQYCAARSHPPNSYYPNPPTNPEDAFIKNHALAVQGTVSNNNGTFNNSRLFSGNFFGSSLTNYGSVQGNVENGGFKYSSLNKSSIEGSQITNNNGFNVRPRT